MKQSSESDAHRELVRMAAKRVLDDYNVENLEMTFHEAHNKQPAWNRRTATLEAHLWTGMFISKSGYRLTAHWKLVPDIIAYILAEHRKQIEPPKPERERKRQTFFEEEEPPLDLPREVEMETVETCIVIEAETDPNKGILANKQRILGYRMIGARFEQEDNWGNPSHRSRPEHDAKFIMAIYDDIKFPKGTKKDPLPTDADVFDEIWRFKRGK